MKNKKNKQIALQAKEIMRLEEELIQEKKKYTDLEIKYIDYRNKVRDER